VQEKCIFCLSIFSEFSCTYLSIAARNKIGALVSFRSRKRYPLLRTCYRKCIVLICNNVIAGQTRRPGDRRRWCPRWSGWWGL